MAERNCDMCAHEQACAAWIRHCAALYNDFEYSTENCSHFSNAADVVEVVHGEVEMLTAKERVEVDCMCKACGTRMRTDDNYCPNCGAKMKKEQIS